jgi:hypothetical protein
LTLDGDFLAFLANESDEGKDLNQDGDTTDSRVLHVFDARTGVVRNLGLQVAYSSPLLVATSSFVAFNVNEADLGIDVDGNGDALSDVLCLYSRRAQEVYISELTGILFADVFTTQVGLLVRKGQGAYFFDSRSGEVRDTNLPLSGYPVWSVPAWSGQILGVWEDTDINGDGDTSDIVLYWSDPALRKFESLGTVASSPPLVTGRWAYFSVPEHAGDLNGDGDGWDSVLFRFDRLTGTTTNLKLALGRAVIASPGAIGFGSNGFAAFLADEFWQNEDLNGNGDLEDKILFTVAYGGTPHSTEISSDVLLGGNGKLVAYRTQPDDDGHREQRLYDASRQLDIYMSEFGQTHVSPETASFFRQESVHGDLNGDGQIHGKVLHAYSRSRGEVLNIGVEGAGYIPAIGPWISSSHTECESSDSNRCVTLFNEHTRQHWQVAGGLYAAFLSDRLLAYTVSETGVDLNGDGDGGDDVVHIVKIPRSGGRLDSEPSVTVWP